MALVVDASALVDLYLGSEVAPAIVTRVHGEALHAPVTVDAEILHSLRRHLLSGSVDEALAERAIVSHRSLVITRHPIAPLVQRMWAMRQNVTAYDAGYVALAESLNLTLITRDRRLSRSPGHTARIEYID